MKNLGNVFHFRLYSGAWPSLGSNYNRVEIPPTIGKQHDRWIQCFMNEEEGLFPHKNCSIRSVPSPQDRHQSGRPNILISSENPSSIRLALESALLNHNNIETELPCASKNLGHACIHNEGCFTLFNCLAVYSYIAPSKIPTPI